MSEKTQLEMFWEAHRRIAESNALFMDMVREGLKKDELRRLIKLRPNLWGRFAHWIEVLPE